MYKIWQPMKYATAKKPEVLKAALLSPDYCIQLKKDGSSYVLAKDTDGSVHLYGDKISKKDGKVIDKIENVPHIKEWAEQHLPPETQLCVEICYGKESRDVNTIMLALPAKAVARQKETQLCQMYVFDFLYWGGEALYEQDFADRWYNGLEYLSIELLPDGEPRWITIAETVFDNKDDKISEWLAAGEEGGVLKLLHSNRKTSAAHHVRELGATPARPMNTTFKIKQVDTLDVIIIGYTEPEKEYTGKDPDTYQYRDDEGNPVNRLWKLGMFNAFIIGACQEDGQVIKIGTVASGLTDEIRLGDPVEYLGQVIEITCMEKNIADHTLRHPRFMRFRPDKAPEDCVMEEIFK